MPVLLDLRPSAQQVTVLLAGVTDDRLRDPTPCPDYTVADLLAHLMGLCVAFREAGRKQLGPETAVDPGSTRPDLDPLWRSRLPQRLDELVAVWQRPAAWQGETQAGGVTLSGETAGLVAGNELLLHGWDLARATGQDYLPDVASLHASHGLLSQSTDPADREGLFGPVVPVPQGASLLSRVVGLAGRTPGWTPTDTC
ncbi:TIGR03086 family metal-binding protein [Streptomyces sp. 549]|uniref:TIGR03086 family metal-binding protein n=1 Tax=Streptomyces sp. 549 TaxID=3049076 RepID=UPI0024C38D9C|nr:TIGR03086 family metal-binding protein [Streptomyces sp. 549]MDK1474961.1 TIGR03086 family metal-binding protein [Streptomyces sp. 549]